MLKKHTPLTKERLENSKNWYFFIIIAVCFPTAMGLNKNEPWLVEHGIPHIASGISIFALIRINLLERKIRNL